MSPVVRINKMGLRRCKGGDYHRKVMGCPAGNSAYVRIVAKDMVSR